MHVGSETPTPDLDPRVVSLTSLKPLDLRKNPICSTSFTKGRGVDDLACRMYAEGMSTTTIRVDTETHARLLELSESTGRSLMATVSDAAEALRRQRFAHQVAAELQMLRDDPEAWSAYLAEGDTTSVADGLG